jgi:phage-related tail protein
MLGDDELKELQDEIKMLEEQLRERKRELSEKRYAGLRAAMEARKEADQLLSEELRALGVRRVNWHPFLG